ncbi:MAG: protein kinase [Lachnospiraceae bacterium]|nr:protein kinase [Lachnospiraceae bacterium]
MNYEDRLRLSYYKEISDINREHGVFLVKHTESGEIFVKKVLDHFNINVYQKIMDRPIRHMPKVYDLIEADGKLIVIEEYVSGNDLDEICKKRGGLPEYQVMDIALDICEVLSRLHGFDPPVIHRDIKPSNVKISPAAGVVVLDLDAAKLDKRDKAVDTELLGTHGYAAPEQYGFGASTVRTDIYGLGKLMEAVAAANISEGLQRIIDKCTMLKPEERFASADELAGAIRFCKNVSQTGKAPERVNTDRQWQTVYNDIPEENEDPSPNYKKFLPPGVASKKPVIKLISAFLYIAWFYLTYIALPASGRETGKGTSLAASTSMFLWVVVPILILGNYLGIRDKLIKEPDGRIKKSWPLFLGGFILAAEICVAVIAIIIAAIGLAVK